MSRQQKYIIPQEFGRSLEVSKLSENTYGFVGIDIRDDKNYLVSLSDLTDKRITIRVPKISCLDFPANLLSTTKEGLILCNSNHPELLEAIEREGLNYITPPEVFFERRLKFWEDYFKEPLSNQMSAFDIHQCHLYQDHYYSKECQTRFVRTDKNNGRRERFYRFGLYDKSGNEIKTALANDLSQLTEHFIHYNSKFCREFVFGNNKDMLFAFHLSTNRFIHIPLKSKPLAHNPWLHNRYTMVDINDEYEVMLKKNRELLILKLNDNKFTYVSHFHFKEKVKYARFTRNQILVAFNRIHKIIEKKSGSTIKEFWTQKRFVQGSVLEGNDDFSLLYLQTKYSDRSWKFEKYTLD